MKYSDDKARLLQSELDRIITEVLGDNPDLKEALIVLTAIVEFTADTQGIRWTTRRKIYEILHKFACVAEGLDKD